MTTRGSHRPPARCCGRTGSTSWPWPPVATTQCGSPKQRAADQKAAAGKTETARQDATTALSTYKGSVKANQQKWASQHKGQYKTQQQAQTAWQNAWDNSDDGKAAKQALAPHLQAYANAAADEMRVAAENGGGDVNGAIQQKAADIKGRTDGKADHTQWEDKVLDSLIDGPDGVAAAITNETPAVRAANLEISRAFDDRDAALADVSTLEGQRTRDLKALSGTPGRFLREDVNESYSGQIAAARNNLTLAETNLRAALKTGLATIGAALVVADAKNNIKNLANSPALRNAAERQQTATDLSAAEQQYRNVLAGDTELEVYTPEQVSTALNTLMTYHPELMKPENFPVAMDLMLDAGALTVKPELDAKLATLSVDANTPDWMKSLINDKGDKVTAALIVTLGVDGVKPQGRAEEILARDDPMAFAMLKYAGGSVPYPESNINGVEPTEADILKAGREATSTAVQNLALTTGKSADKVKSDQQDLMRLQLLIRASGDVRADYVQQQVTGLLAGQTAEAGVKRLLEDYLEGKDLSDPNWDPTTNGGKAMKIIKVNTEASFSADQAAQIWAQAGPEMTAYINKQANFIQTEYSHDDGYAAAIGEWQKHMGQFASPDGAKAIFTATTAISDPALIGRHGGGRMTDGLQVLADRDPETAANIAQWVTDPTGKDSWGIPIRDLVTVKEDGTGIALGQAILDRMRSKGADEYALDDLQRTFDYGYKEAVQKQGEAARGEQFDLFNNDRNKKLQDIFDSAIAGTGDLYETKQKFGDDPIKDNAIGQAMHLAPDNPAAGTGQALYTDPAKLAQIHEVKQVNMIGDALQMGADRNGGLGEINYTDEDKLKRINKIREWVADVGGGSALVSFLPAVYASARDGVSPMFLMRVEGDKNNDGVITRDRTTKMADDGYTSIPIADEDMILDTSMAGDAVAGQNVPVKYADFGAFQKENLLDDHGKLYMSGSDDMLLHDDDKDGHVDKIDFNGTDAAITTAWEHVTEWGDRAVGVTAAVAGVALLIGSGGTLAPVVLAGASIWGIYRTAETVTQMSEHGQSFQPFKPGTKGAWLGLFDPVASGVLLGGIASVSGLAALKPLSLIRSFAPLGTSVEEAGTALRAAGMSDELVSRMGSNAGTELAGRYGIRSNLYRAGLADVPRPVALTAQISGAALLGGQSWSLTEAAINGEDFGKLGWDILLTGLGIGSYATGHVAGRMARSAAAADAAMPSQPSPRELAIRQAAALSGRDVAHLTGDEAAALPTDAVPAIAPDRFAQIGTDALGALTTEHVGAITGDQLEALPRNRLRELTIAQLKAIPAKLIPRIAPGRLTAMRPDQIAALTLEQQAYLTVHQVAALTTDQLSAMTPEQLGAFTLAQRHALGPSQLKAFESKPGDSAAALAYKQAQLKALSEPWQETAFGRIPLATDPHLYTGKEPLSVKIDTPVDHLTADELAAFSPQQLAAFTPEQKAALYPEQLELLDTAQIEALESVDAAASVGGAAPVTVEPVRFVPRLLHKLSGPDISKILPSDIGTVHPNRLMQLRFDQRTALTGEQIAAIRPRRLAQLAPHLMRRLTPDQVASFTREQMSWLTKAQVAGLTPDQLRALHPAQLATFTPEQRAALKPAQWKAFEPRPDDSPVVAEYRRAQAAALDTPWLETQYGAMSFVDAVPHPYNNFAARTLTGLPPGRASSPVHEVANAYVGRSARVFGTRSGVEAAARVLHALKRDDLSNPTRIVLVTGFSVAKGMPETDGPPGTALLGHMLTHLGYDVTYVTDRANKRVMQKTLEAVGDMREGNLKTFSAPHFGPFATRRAAKLLDRLNPDAVMTIELPGRNQSGVPKNMRGVITAGFNPPLDEILNVANQRKGITTFAVGDGGNEAGLGRVRADEAGRPLGYIPNALDRTEMAAVSTADYLITASVSNWGAEAVAAALAKRAGRTDLLTILDEQSAAIDASAKAGAVDGVTRFQKPSVDGFTKEAHEGWLNMLLRGTDATYMEPIYLGLMDSSDGGLYAARTMAEYLTEITGRRLVRVLALDHANAPYGNPKYTSQDIGRMTNAPLKMLTRVLNGTASRQVLAMACNTACTGDGYDFGITVSVPGAGPTDTRVVDLVNVTAAKMIDPDIGGARPVSLSTSGTERSHAYRDAVRVMAPAEWKSPKSAQAPIRQPTWIWRRWSTG